MNIFPGYLFIILLSYAYIYVKNFHNKNNRKYTNANSNSIFDYLTTKELFLQ